MNWAKATAFDTAALPDKATVRVREAWQAAAAEAWAAEAKATLVS